MKLKKILAQVLAAAMILSSIGTVAFADVAPTGTMSSAYTSENTYWGECGGDAKESFMFKLYNDDTYMGYTSLNNIDGIIDGDVYVTWHIKLDAESNTDGYWTMAWEKAPAADMQPNRVEQWVDGVKVAECDIQLNGPDNLNKIVAAIADDNDIIKGYYTTLAAAFDAAEKGDTIELLSDVTVTEPITVEGEVVLDLNGKTMAGSILAPNATLTIKNGTIVNTDSSVSAIEINAGELTLTDINIDSARHAVRIDGEVTATINSGTYKITSVTAGITQHAVNVSNGADVTINGGTFTGPKGTDADSGSAVNAQANSTVTINDGTYSGGKNSTLSAKGTLVVCGGTFDQDPSKYLAEDILLSKNADGTYSVGNLPNAEVKNLGAITIDEYSIYTGSLTDGGDPIDLQVAMEFIAKDTPEEAARNAFGQYTTDFFITIDGIEGDSFVADGCYLAGNYGTFGWIMIPLDGMEIVEGKVYPVITSVGFDFTYEDICTSVKDFKCGIYFSDKVIEANPDMQVTLTLGLSESIEVAQNAEFITVDQPYTYKVTEFEKTETVWTTATDAGYYTKDGKTLGLMRFLFMVESEGMNGFGIDYMKADKETVAKSVQNSTIVSGESTIIFYGDICDFEEADAKEKEYSARGFAVIGEDYDYSDIISCTPDFTKALIYGGNN